MKKKKILISMISLIVVCFLLSVFVLELNKTKNESVRVVSNISDAQIVVQSVDTAVEQEEQIAEETKIDKPVAEAIKERVREVIEGALDFFIKDKKIVSIGDSLTQGVGDETDSGGYVGILNHTFEDNHVNITIENFGKRGNRSDQLLKRLEQEEIASAISEADIVMITIGANDIMKVVRSNYTNLNMEPFQKERIQYLERLTAIFNKINDLNPDTQIYLIGFYNPFERYFGDIEQLELILDNWNNAGKAVTEEFDNIYYIPTKDLFSNSAIDLLADDNFHPNTDGYKRIAERVLEYLNEFSVENELPIEDIE
ncbi:SGNH/GDSL hydrolase family protein [Litchfieldia alkalitelluris]|uniref:SGNH/GDSL hydrolase family protein n=1 Tax=Litchfieldia alkalitelluris TaxID=304268 RepID=UPI000997F9B5|nr:SGNH/GDSL hydrolase family protein [Litchfieldia alkalitelluris]